MIDQKQMDIAATKVQAAQRGRLARRGGAMKKVDVRQAAAEEAAATKLQSAERGRKARSTLTDRLHQLGVG